MNLKSYRGLIGLLVATSFCYSMDSSGPCIIDDICNGKDTSVSHSAMYLCEELKKMQQCAANPQADQACNATYRWENKESWNPYQQLLWAVGGIYNKAHEEKSFDPHKEIQEPFDRFNDAQHYVNVVVQETNKLQKIEEDNLTWSRDLKSWIQLQYNKYVPKETPRKPVITKPAITTQLEKICETEENKWGNYSACKEVNKALLYTAYKPTSNELKKAHEQNNAGVFALEDYFESRWERYQHAKELENGIIPWQIKHSFNDLRMANNLSEKELYNALGEFIEKLQALRRTRA